MRARCSGQQRPAAARSTVTSRTILGLARPGAAAVSVDQSVSQADRDRLPEGSLGDTRWPSWSEIRTALPPHYDGACLLRPLPRPDIIMLMEALTALLGAVVGGVLVLVGEILRRRAERRDRAMERLLDACAKFAMVINKTCGEMVDARLQQLPRPASALRAERHEATTQFFMTPAPSELHDAGRHLAYAYHDLYDHFDDDEGWIIAWDNYRATIMQFEATVRAVAGRETSWWGAAEGKTIPSHPNNLAKEPRSAEARLPSSIRPYGWRRGSESGPSTSRPGE